MLYDCIVENMEHRPEKKKRLKKMKIIASGEWKSEVGKGEWSGAAVFVF